MSKNSAEDLGHTSVQRLQPKTSVIHHHSSDRTVANGNFHHENWRTQSRPRRMAQAASTRTRLPQAILSPSSPNNQDDVKPRLVSPPSCLLWPSPPA